MNSLMKLVVASAGVASLSGVATAGVLVSSLTSQNIFGSNYNIQIYNVANDLTPSIGTETFTPRLEPEGMVFFNGVLYVSGDAATPGPNESNGYVAAYPGGSLGSTPAAIGRFVTPAGRVLGPEGLAINTRGSGYGSFAGPVPSFVAIDNAGGADGRVLAVLDASVPGVTNVQQNFGFGFEGPSSPAINSEDIAFVPGADASSDRFAIIDANGINNSGIPAVKWLSTDANPVQLPGGFDLVDQAKGMVFLPAADAALFAPNANVDALLIAVSPAFAGDTNKLVLYSLDGVILASSDLLTGIASGGFGNIEALAWDPDTRRLFIGDETGASSQIAVLVIPSPAAGGLLSVVLIAAGRRRR